MLDLQTRMEKLGVTLYRDFDRPNHFYHLPGSPHIVMDGGRPAFDLFSYRKGGEASETVSGGFLNMTVGSGIGALKDRIEALLREEYGDDVVLSSVPLTKSDARLIALGEDSAALKGGVERETAPSGGPLVASGPRFVESILGAAQTALDPENRAIFSLSLSEDGTAFMLGVLSGAPDAAPMGVVYKCEFVGLMPAYDLEITIDFKSVYEYMRSRFTLGTLFFKADVDNIVEELRRQEKIKIKEVARTLELSTPEAIRERQGHIDQLVKDLATGALFQPSLVPGQPKATGETVTASDPTTTIGTAATTGSGAVAGLAYGPAAAAAGGMADAFGAAARTQAPGEGEQPASRGQVDGAQTPAGEQPANTPGQPAEGASAADVWNRLGRPQAAFALKSIEQTEERTVTYNLTQVSAQKQTIAPQGFLRLLANPRDLNDRVHIVDLKHDFFQRVNVDVGAREVDFTAEGITQMVVQLRYGTRPGGAGPKDTAEAILRGPQDAKAFTFFADEAQSQSYEYKLIADYRGDFGIGVRDVRVEGEWTRTEARSLAVHPRWLGLTVPLTVQPAPNIPDDVDEIHVTVRYARPDRGIDDSALVRVAPGAAPSTLHIRKVAAEDPVEIRQRVFYADGAQEDLPLVRLPDPAAGESDDAVVIGVPRADRLDGDVILVDALGELASVVVDTQVLQRDALVEANSLEIATGTTRQTWSVRLPAREEPATLRCRERRVYRDGGVESLDWREPGTTNLVVGIPAEGVLPVAVRYLGPPPSALGLSALIVDLEYAGANGNGEFAQRKSLLIDDEPTSQIQEWKVRLADRQDRTYTWRLTLLHDDGTESATEPTTDTRDKLILRVPQG